MGDDSPRPGTESVTVCPFENGRFEEILQPSYDKSVTTTVYFVPSGMSARAVRRAD